MTATLPVPVRDAIAVSYRISPSLGATVDDLIATMWGDVERVRGVAALWESAAGEAEGSIASLRREIRAVADGEFWDGAAKDGYQRWIEQLVGRTMVPLCNGLDETRQVLGAAADTVEDIRVALINRCFSFTGAVAGVIGAGAGPGATLLPGFAGWFVTELLDVRAVYASALDAHAARMREIRELAAGPVTPADDMLGGWDGGEHGDGGSGATRATPE